MQYTALYRKLRPRTFRAIVGQEHIVRTLKNQLATGRISHAYLFCGTRGTGKTSIAKIFAHAVNCENLKGPEACGDCQSCRAIKGGYSLNVIEIDAASNNSVDNVRDIREEVKYPPANGKYKVYIIDEVHMLSTGAFNALLKTLEEPPEYVIFILATTDPQKIPATVHSRCQRFDFRRITAMEISQSLTIYSNNEGLEINADALHYIASIADGSMRDALSILDQCTTFYFNQVITLENVLTIVGAVDDRVFFELTDALYKLNGMHVMEIVEEISAHGRDIGRFVSDFIAHLRNLLVARSVKEPCAALNLSAEAVERLAEQAVELPSNVLIHYINTFSELQAQFRYIANGRILLEVCCLQLCNPQEVIKTDMATDAITDARLRKLEADIKNVIQHTEDGTAANSSKNTIPPEAVKTPEAPPTSLKKSIPGDIAEVCKSWPKFVAKVKHIPLCVYLKKASPAYLEGDALMLISESVAMPEVIRKYETDIKAALAQEYNRDFDLIFISRDEYNERHKRLYGAPDDNNVFSLESFTEKLMIDIIVED